MWRWDELVLRGDNRLPVHVDPAPQAIRVDNLAAVEAGQRPCEVPHVLNGPAGRGRVGFEGAVEERHGHVTDLVRLERSRSVSMRP